MVAKCESNESGGFSAQLALVGLMSGREIDNVLFLGKTKIFEEENYIAFLLLLRPTYMQQ